MRRHFDGDAVSNFAGFSHADLTSQRQCGRSHRWISQATQNIVQDFAGTLSDKLQRRKPIALVGYFLAAISKPLMGLATVWQVVFGARLLDRFGAGTRSAPRDALIASSVAEENGAALSGLRE